jgi:hypothetical protein
MTPDKRNGPAGDGTGSHETAGQAPKSVTRTPDTIRQARAGLSA